MMRPECWLILLLCSTLVTSACAQSPTPDSGGPLLPEQAAYDVTFYDLDLNIQPREQRIGGVLTAHARVVDSLDVFVLNLDRRLAVEQVRLIDERGRRARLSRERRAEDNQLWIELPRTYAPGGQVRVEVTYGGAPRTAPNPPWNGGFTWAETPRGAPWIATSCQTAGADLWWPVKDHPSDEPDSMAMQVTVPDSLVAVMNGRLRAVTHPADSLRTYNWFVSTPINNYGVALNVAPYASIDTSYASVSGEEVPVSFFALPGEQANARRVLPDLLEHVRFLEETLRPYPFADDKYGIARTPFLGMEHQTIIAHGAELGNTDALGYEAGFDALHFHELAHEWFGNFVTARDWKDFWIHEGFATYMEALYAGELRGDSAYATTVDYFRDQITNRRPIARREPTSAQAMYGGDVYYKGAVVLHTLRYLIGDEAFFTALRRMAGADRSEPRLVDTQDFVRIAEEASEQELDWFFDTYLYQAELPRLVVQESEGEISLRWRDTAAATFPMPVEVRVGGELQQVTVRDKEVSVPLDEGEEYAIDPNRQILMNVPPPEVHEHHER